MKYSAKRVFVHFPPLVFSHIKLLLLLQSHHRLLKWLRSYRSTSDEYSRVSFLPPVLLQSSLWSTGLFVFPLNCSFGTLVRICDVSQTAGESCFAISRDYLRLVRENEKCWDPHFFCFAPCFALFPSHPPPPSSATPSAAAAAAVAASWGWGGRRVREIFLWCQTDIIKNKTGGVERKIY